MEEDIRLELFTVAEVRNWLVHNQSVRGLSEQLIAKTRAWAIVNNPYATDDLNIISTIFVNDVVAAYTYLFPDKVQGELIYWNTTLYCSPQYEGRGYAAIVIGQFVELYGENYFDLDAMPASIENLKFNGLNVTFVEQYVLEKKHINTTSIKGKLASLKEKLRNATQARVSQLKNEIKNASYHIEYVPFVDDETYAFILEHSRQDLFVRSQKSLNWILQYPFMQESPIKNRVKRTLEFSSTRQQFRYHAVRVLKNQKLIGFYILNESVEVTYVNYIYFDTNYKKEVFCSILEHILQFGTKKVFTSNQSLADYINEYHLYPHYRVYKKSFAYPKSFNYDESKNIQAGDGDNIT